MAVGDKIRTVDYNNIQNVVAKVLGASSTGSECNFGYGQILLSSQVDTLSRVTVNEYSNLQYDIINAYVHQNGSTPTLPEAVEGNKVKFNSTTEPVSYWQTIANNLSTNRLVQPPLSQRQTVNKGTQSRNFSWSSLARCVVTVSFSSSAAARHFFNSGGEIRFTSSRSGGTSSSQNTSWTNLLNGAGTRRFGANVPGTGLSPTNGQNFYRCGSAFSSAWSSVSGSSPYGSNSWQIFARTPGVTNNTGTASSIEFRVDWIDNYTDPGPPAPGDLVNGTLSLSVETLEAQGNLQPVSSGLFTVESPTVSIGSIT